MNSVNQILSCVRAEIRNQIEGDTKEVLLGLLRNLEDELKGREELILELCDWASEAREFFGTDVSDTDAYAVAHHLGEVEKLVRKGSE